MSKRIKERLSRGFLDHLFHPDTGLLREDPWLNDEVAKRCFYEDGEFTHPSVIIAVGKLDPIEPEVAGIYTGTVIFRVTSLMDSPTGLNESEDPRTIHDERVGAIDLALTEFVNEPSLLPGLNLHLVEHADNEEQIDTTKRLYSDLLALTVFAQGCD